MVSMMEKIIEKIRLAIVEKNFESFSENVDTEKFLNDGYPEVVEELAKNCSKFHELYPHDLLFKFGSIPLKIYMTKFKSVHLGFVRRVISAYFDKNLTPPKNFLSAPIDFSAVELEKFLKALSFDIKNISGNIAEIKILGNNSYYGKVFGSMSFKFVIENNKIVGVKNIPELVPPILDIAEKFWPSAWDLGIKL